MSNNKLYLHNIDLNKNQIVNPVLHNATTPPSTPVDGQMYYNTTEKAVYYYNNTEWKKLGGITGGTTNYVVKYSAADAITAGIIYDDGTNIGIGTTSPTAKVHVLGNAYFEDTTTRSNITTGVRGTNFKFNNIISSTVNSGVVPFGSHIQMLYQFSGSIGTTVWGNNIFWPQRRVIDINSSMNLNNATYVLNGNNNFPNAALAYAINLGSNDNSTTVPLDITVGSGIETGMIGSLARMDFFPNNDSGASIKYFKGIYSTYASFFDLKAAAGSTHDTIIHFAGGSYRHLGGVQVDNMIGVYVTSMKNLSTGKFISNSYAFSQDGPNDKNFFAGGAILGSLVSSSGSALLQINSTTKGFLFPRMTLAQRDLIYKDTLAIAIDTPGSGYVDGTYTKQYASPNTTTNGVGMTVNVTVAGGVVTDVQLVVPGTNYAVNDLLTVTKEQLRSPSGTGFKFKVVSLVDYPTGLTIYQTDNTEGLYTRRAGSTASWERYITTYDLSSTTLLLNSSSGGTFVGYSSEPGTAGTYKFGVKGNTIIPAIDPTLINQPSYTIRFEGTGDPLATQYGTIGFEGYGTNGSLALRSSTSIAFAPTTGTIYLIGAANGPTLFMSTTSWEIAAYNNSGFSFHNKNAMTSGNLFRIVDGYVLQYYIDAVSGDIFQNYTKGSTYIGHTSAPTSPAKLDVMGSIKSRLSSAGNFIEGNYSGTTTFQIGQSGYGTFNGGLSSPRIAFFDQGQIGYSSDGYTLATSINQASTKTLTFLGDLRFAYQSTVNSVFHFSAQYGSNSTHDAGNIITIATTNGNSLGRTTSAGTNNILNIIPTYNFTGTATGTIRGIYYNPTLTSMVGQTHNAIELATGNFVLDKGLFQKNIYTDTSLNAYQFKIGTGYELYGTLHSAGGFRTFITTTGYTSGYEIVIGNNAYQTAVFSTSSLTLNAALVAKSGISDVSGGQNLSTFSVSPHTGFKYNTTNGWNFSIRNSADDNVLTAWLNGNVGIGTTAMPTYKFDVNGSARFNGDTYCGQDILISFGSGTRYIQSPNGSLGFLSSNSTGNTLWTQHNRSGVQGRFTISVESTSAQVETLTLGNISTQTSPSTYGAELHFRPHVNHVQTYVAIRGGDSTYGGATTTPVSLYIFGGQNTTNSVYGNIYLAYDFTTPRGSVGIGTGSINSSAILQIDSSTKGFLPPRMTTTNRNAISSPAVGLSIYNTTTNKMETWDGTVWNAHW